MLSHFTPTLISATLAEHRRALQSLVAASHAALDHAEAITATNLAAIDQIVWDLEQQLHQLQGADDRDVRAARQVAVFTAGLERAGDNMQHLLGAIRQLQASARLVLSQRVMDALDEAEAMDGHVRPG